MTLCIVNQLPFAIAQSAHRRRSHSGDEVVPHPSIEMFDLFDIASVILLGVLVIFKTIALLKLTSSLV